MKSKNIIEHFYPSDLLKERFLAIHEAAFLLTDWPKHNLFKTSICFNNVVIGDLLLDRQYIYLPKEEKIDPKKYGKRFKNVYNHLKEAIEKGDLSFNNFRVKGNIYFLTPHNFVSWALINGYIFPIPLPEPFQIYSQDETPLELHPKTRAALPMKVREKITAQLILAIDPKPSSRTDLCEKVLIYVDPRRTDLTGVRDNINELYEFPGKKGRNKQNANGQSDSYILRPMEEILSENLKGRLCCNYQLLFVAIKQSIYFKKKSYTKDRIEKMNRESFCKEFLGDDVLSIYFQDSEFVMGIVKKWIDEAWYELNSILGIYDDMEKSFLSNYNKIKTASTLTIGQALALTEPNTLN